mmetsp:Transcript_20648/g.33635  ORF Transcript_20648/g.33635 Transcript_20648/m.33635 type:complete len:92 (+) Transcript_20648:431-706(+)
MGIAPNQRPDKFINPTLVATERRDMYFSGSCLNRRLLFKSQTETTLLSVVSGSCASPAFKNPFQTSSHTRLDPTQTGGKSGLATDRPAWDV